MRIGYKTFDIVPPLTLGAFNVFSSVERDAPTRAAGSSENTNVTNFLLRHTYGEGEIQIVDNSVPSEGNT